jgi:hypothetical protein
MQTLNLQYFAGLGHAAGLDAAGAGGMRGFFNWPGHANLV